MGYQKTKLHDQDFKVIKKNEAILKMFNQWLIVKQEGKSIAAYLKENNFNKIAIYGMSYAGERLLDDLKGTDIEVAYAVDQNADRMFAEVEMITKEEIAHQQEVDAVIVTAIYFFDDIEDKIVVGLGVVPDAGFLRKALFHQIQNSHSSTTGDIGILNVPPNLLFFFPQGKPFTFPLGRAVCGFQL